MLEGLTPVPDGTALVCYRCKVSTATAFKWMGTPSGGVYKRGWCDACQAGVPLSTRTDLDDESRPLKIGQRVTVTFPGEVLHYIPGEKDLVAVLHGFTVYTINVGFVEDCRV